MERSELQKVLDAAAQECGCTVYDVVFNDDDNIFEVTLSKPEGSVTLADCEQVHRAVLSAFDRDVEDYSLTVSSRGISAEEADALLKTIEN